MGLKKKINLGVIISILVIVILLWVVLAYNMFNLRTSFDNLLSEIKNTQSSLSLTTKENKCPEGIIPNTLILDRAVDYKLEFNGELYFSPYRENKWADETEIGEYTNPNFVTFQNDCFKGKNEGENINYFYCKGLTYYKSKTPISDSGVIGETKVESYTIDLVLKEINTDEECSMRSAWGDCSWTIYFGTYEIVDATCIKQ